jgi:ATP-dependent Clp protease protease subunit
MTEHTGRDFDTISRDCERDKWLDADESVAYGVADQILKHLPDSIAGVRSEDNGDE